MHKYDKTHKTVQIACIDVAVSIHIGYGLAVYSIVTSIAIYQ